MEIFILDIPLIRREIAQYFSQNDFARCALVSKEWNEWFTPNLWSHPRFGYNDKLAPLTGLEKNKDYIQSIRYRGAKPEGLISKIRRWAFPNLRCLGLSLCNSNQDLLRFVTSTKCALRLVETTPTLQSLELRLSEYQDQIHGQLIQVLESHPGLQEFKLMGMSNLNPILLQEIIQACCRFEHIDFDAISTPIVNRMQARKRSQEALLAIDRLVEMENTNLQELCIRQSHSLDEAPIVAPLLRKCPLLRKLHLPMIKHWTTMRDLSIVFGSGHCSKLQEISLGCLDLPLQSAEMSLADIFSSIGSTSEDCVISYGSGSGLQSVSLHRDIGFRSQAASSLVRLHSRTMTSMNLSLNTPVHLSVFANLMHGLPKLRTIIAQVSLDNYAEEDDPDMSAVTEMEWECFCLVDFSVGFHLKSSSDNIPLAEWGKSKVESSLSYIFSQVAQLQSLNTLKMTCGIALLTVDTKSGYLSRLSQLKKLKQLHFEETQCALGSVGSLEAEWMIKNWPWLSQVGYFTQDQVMDRGGPFLTTLVNNRPWIQIAPLLLE